MSCVICGSTENLVSHHISYEPEIIETLCKSCHREIHCHTSIPRNPVTKGFLLVRVETALLQQARKLFPESQGLTATGLVDLLIRKVLKEA
jgi:hypothetical protein